MKKRKASGSGDGNGGGGGVVRLEPLTVYLCALNIFVGYCDRVNMAVAIVAMAREYHWDTIETGHILGGFFYGYVCSQLIGSLLSARYGGRLTLFVVTFLWSLTTYLTPEAADSSLVLLMACRVILGLAEGFSFPSIYNIFSTSGENERSRNMGLLHGGGSAGTIFALFVSEHLVQHYDWRLVFRLFGFVGFAWCLWWAAHVGVRKLFSGHDRMSQQRAPRSATASASYREPTAADDASVVDLHGSDVAPGVPRLGAYEHAAPLNLRGHTAHKASVGPGTAVQPIAIDLCSKTTYRVIVNLATHPYVRPILVGHFCHATSMFVGFSWLPTYYHSINSMHVSNQGHRHAGRSLDTDGMAATGLNATALELPSTETNGHIVTDSHSHALQVAAPYALMALFNVLGGKIADRMLKMGKSKTTVRRLMGGVGYGLSFVAMMLFVITPVALPTLKATFLSFSFGFSTLTTAGHEANKLDVAPPELAGILQGVSNTLAAFGGVVGVPAAAYLYKATHTWISVFIGIGAIFLMGSITGAFFAIAKRIPTADLVR